MFLLLLIYFLYLLQIVGDEHDVDTARSDLVNQKENVNSVTKSDKKYNKI